MTSILLSTLLLVQLNTSCSKEKAIVPCVNGGNNPSVLNQDFELLWKVRDNRGFVSYGTVVTPTSVVYFYDPPGPGGDDIVALDKANGDTLWIKTAQGSTSKHQFKDGNLYFSQSDELYCINASTGVNLWSFDGNGGELADYTFGNGKVFAYIYYNGLVGPLTNLFSLNPSTGTSQLEFTIDKADRDGYRQRPKGMIYYQHPNGNEIIFTQSSGHNITITTSRGEYFAVDITNDSMYWDLGEYFYDGDINSRGISASPILINNHNLIINNYKYNASLDLQTKNENWRTLIPSQFRTGIREMAELNGKCFQSPGNFSQFNIINTSDGSLHKNYGNIGGENWSAAMAKYNNHIYVSTTFGFYKMDANGTIVKQLLRSDKLSEDVSGTIQTFDIDPTTGYIYATVGFNLVCFKEK